MKLESWGYPEEKLVFQWAEEGNAVVGRINKTLSQHYFKVEYLSKTNNTYNGISDGKNHYTISINSYFSPKLDNWIVYM
jgi:hypothetical protein